MTTSGTYAFNPSLVDLVLDAWDRCEIRPSALTPDHMFSARRSLNFVMSRWTNRAVNLWLVEEVTVPMVSGQSVYTCAAGTAAVLDVFSRNYQLGETDDITANIATVLASASVTITWVANGLVADQWVSVPIPVSIGGVVVQGFYQVATVPTADTFTVVATNVATATTSGGAVPSYATTALDATVTVTLADHGYSAGQTWTVHETVLVGGLALLGDYTITAATTNTLTFEAPTVAGSTDTESENGGLMQAAQAPADSLPQDRVMSPLGYTEWSQIPSKSTVAFTPTSFWFDRQINPSIYVWPVPDLTSPLELHYFRMRQLQDANPQNTETPDIPYRAEEAFCAELAVQLAVKWKPDKVEMLRLLAKDAWDEFAREDRERVPLKVQPQLGGYYN